VIDLTFQLRVVTDQMVREALYPEGSDSRCQFDLTHLTRSGYLSTLPRERVNDPALYLLDRRSSSGTALMKERWGEQTFRRRMFRLGSLPHLLSINRFRVRVIRACKDLGWNLTLWQTHEDLLPTLGRSARLKANFVPDAYFRIAHPVDGEVKTASFFLELQQSLKSSGTLLRKLTRYSEFFYAGAYSQWAGVQGLRVQVVFTSERFSKAETRVRHALQQAEAAGVSLVRFVTLEELCAGSPAEVLTAPLWWKPGQSSPVPLFHVGS
jgi:hypothetical protein